MNREMFIARWPNFKPEEFMCQCGRCGEASGLLMKAETLNKLQSLRADSNFPFFISSGFRCANHPAEKKKSIPGAHGKGQAIDVHVDGVQALNLASKATMYGFTGIGINQKGTGRFIHLDDMDNQPNRPRPWIWSY